VRSAGPLWHHRYQHRVQQLTRCAPRPARGPGGIYDEYIYARACGRGCMAPCVLVIMRVKRAALARGLGLPRDWRGGATIGWCQTSKTPADCHQCTARQVPRSRVAARRIPAAAPAWLRLDCLDRQHADDYSCTDGRLRLLHTHLLYRGPTCSATCSPGHQRYGPPIQRSLLPLEVTFPQPS
jgi:hypothetical protein